MKNKIVNKVFILILSLLIIAYCIVLCSDAVSVKVGIDEAVNRCLNVIIPSLFAFMAVSQFIVSSGIYIIISKPFYFLSKYVMGIPPQLFFVFLMGSLAGYPIGVKLLSDMVNNEKIDKRTAEIMSAFCYCGGPAFYSGTIGLAIFSSVKIGMLVFLSIIISNFLSCIFISHIAKPKLLKSDDKINISSQLFTNSIVSAGKSLFTICIMIVFFSTIMSTLDSFHIFSNIQQLTDCSSNTVVLVKSALEITSLTQITGHPYNLLPYITAICSFGGVCVLLQVAALNKNSFSLKAFFVARIPCAMLSGVICRLLEKYFIPSSVEALSVSNKVFVKVNNFIPSICLILMILLLNYKKRLVISKTV